MGASYREYARLRTGGFNAVSRRNFALLNVSMVCVAIVGALLVGAILSMLATSADGCRSELRSYAVYTALKFDHSFPCCVESAGHHAL